MFPLESKQSRSVEVEKVGFLVSLFLFLSIIDALWRNSGGVSGLRLPAGLFAFVLASLLLGRRGGFFKHLSGGSKRFGQFINDAVVGAGLLVVYFLGVGCTALLARLFGKSFLNTSTKGDSFWKPLDLTTKDKASYFDQF